MYEEVQRIGSRRRAGGGVEEARPVIVQYYPDKPPLLAAVYLWPADGACFVFVIMGYLFSPVLSCRPSTGQLGIRRWRDVGMTLSFLSPWSFHGIDLGEPEKTEQIRFAGWSTVRYDTRQSSSSTWLLIVCSCILFADTGDRLWLWLSNSQGLKGIPSTASPTGFNGDSIVPDGVSQDDEMSNRALVLGPPVLLLRIRRNGRIRRELDNRCNLRGYGLATWERELKREILESGTRHGNAPSRTGARTHREKAIGPVRTPDDWSYDQSGLVSSPSVPLTPEQLQVANIFSSSPFWPTSMNWPHQRHTYLKPTLRQQRHRFFSAISKGRKYVVLMSGSTLPIERCTTGTSTMYLCAGTPPNLEAREVGLGIDDPIPIPIPILQVTKDVQRPSTLLTQRSYQAPTSSSNHHTDLIGHTVHTDPILSTPSPTNSHCLTFLSSHGLTARGMTGPSDPRVAQRAGLMSKNLGEALFYHSIPSHKVPDPRVARPGRRHSHPLAFSLSPKTRQNANRNADSTGFSSPKHRRKIQGNLVHRLSILAVGPSFLLTNDF
ncbi:hypothetical protein ACRALDRAFT_210518 [Sodiomyces alcalophilus JCM 7366]|uniref:uncharacterized protein n=1 Tax=Sodiomyces alcalophilus JCM 7366 TaxID=591952 RepID=UPI0039B3F0C4